MVVRSIPLFNNMQSLPPSGGLMLFAVILGLVLAIAFQMLLANLGIALGLSFARPLFNSGKTDGSPALSEQQISHAAQEDEVKDSFLSQGQLFSAVGLVAGMSLLLTVGSVLFGASFLAVRFSQLVQPLLGITLGLAIWAVYLLLLLTLGGSALGSTAELLLGGAVTSVRRLLDLVKQVLRKPPSQAPSPEQEQGIAALKQQLDKLRDEMTVLDIQASRLTQADQVSQASKSQSPVTAPSANASSASTPQPLKDGSTGESAVAMATAPPSGKKNLNLKAAALSQAAALASTAQTTVTDSWQQAKTQLHQQVDDGASALLSNLNREIQSQAQLALEQVDLSDWSLEHLWDWARHQGRGSDRPSSGLLSDAPKTDSRLHPQNTAPQHSISAALAEKGEPQPLAKPVPAVAQVNRDLKNYLKYTSLTKLDQAALGHKLDELLSPWLEVSENAESPSQAGLNCSADLQAFDLQTFDFAAWQRALQSRKGIEPAQVKQYLTAIEAKLQVLSSLSRDQLDESQGLLARLKAKLAPLLEQLNGNELSLEDFKQLVVILHRGGDVATELSEGLGLDNIDLSSLGPLSWQHGSLREGAYPEQEVLAEPLQEINPAATEASHPAPTPPIAATANKTPKETPETHNAGPVMEHLPGISSDALQSLTDKAQNLFAQLDDSLKQSLEVSSDLLPSQGHPLQYLRDRLPSLSDSLVARLAELPEHTGEQIHQWVEETQGQLEDQIEQAQAGIESSLQALQQQAMEQAEQVRHWAAVAAWWLLGLTLSSAIAAGAAGYLAVTSPWLRLS